MPNRLSCMLETSFGWSVRLLDQLFCSAITKLLNPPPNPANIHGDVTSHKRIQNAKRLLPKIHNAMRRNVHSE